MTNHFPTSPAGGSIQTPYYQPQLPRPDSKKPMVVGYESLAKKLSEIPNEMSSGRRIRITPMYRKFEQLNHRILLHLQDEISELEEELRYLDECIAQSAPRRNKGQMQPASRRNDSRYGGGLQYQRTEALGRIYLKLGQYNQAMSSFHTLSKSAEAAKVEEIQAYRAWMERHAPIDATEAKFLDRANDLLVVSPRRSATTVGGVHSYQSAAMSLPLILALPLVIVAVVPGLLGRLFVISLIGVVEVQVVTSTELIELMAVREWVICSSIYFGVMAVLAGVVN